MKRTTLYGLYGLCGCVGFSIGYTMRSTEPKHASVDRQYHLMSGKDFNEMYGNRKFIKFTNIDEKHNDMSYIDGLNTDILHLVPYDFAPGLYFTEDELTQVYHHSHIINIPGYVRKVTIPNDACVYMVDDNVKIYKANKIILGERIAAEKYIDELVSRPENVNTINAKDLKSFIDYRVEYAKKPKMTPSSSRGRFRPLDIGR